MRFVHDTFPQRVSFGSGEAAAHLEHEIAALGASRVMVIASKREMVTAGTLTGNLRVMLRYDDVVMHVPSKWPPALDDPPPRPRTSPPPSPDANPQPIVA